MKRYLNFKIPPAQLTVLKTYYGWSTLSHDKRFIIHLSFKRYQCKKKGNNIMEMISVKSMYGFDEVQQ